MALSETLSQTKKNIHRLQALRRYDPCFGKKGRNASAWSTTPSKKSPKYVSIKSVWSNKRPTYDVEWSFNTQTKSFGPCQPARTAQADMGRYFSQMHGLTCFVSRETTRSSDSNTFIHI